MNDNNGFNDPNVEPTVVPTVEPTVVPTVEPTVVPNAEPVEPVLNTTAEPVTPPKKSIVKPLLLTLLILLVVGGAGTLVYFKFFRTVTGKEVVNGTINKIFANAIKASEKLEDEFVIDYKSDIIKADGYLTGSVETTDPEIKASLNNINKLSLDYDFRLDLKNLSGSVDFTAKENDTNIGTINAFLKNKVLYIKSDLVTDTFKLDLSEAYDWDSIDISKLPNQDTKAISKLLDKYKKYLNELITDEYITQEEGEYTVEGTNIQGLKTTVTYNTSQQKELQKALYDKMLNDDEYLTIYSSLTMEDKETAKQDLETKKNHVYDDVQYIREPSETIYYYNIYTTKQGKFLGFDYQVNYENKLRTVITIIEKDDIDYIKAYSMDEVWFKCEYNAKEKEFKWVNDAEDNKNETVIIKFIDDGVKVTFSMDDLKVELEGTQKKSDKDIKANFKAGIDYTSDNKNTKLNVEYQQNVSKADSINQFDTTNALDVANGTEQDGERILNDLRQSLNKTTIGQYLLAMLEAQQVQDTELDMPYDNCSPGMNCISYDDMN